LKVFQKISYLYFESLITHLGKPYNHKRASGTAIQVSRRLSVDKRFLQLFYL
jgi:hypothetical protein